MHVSYHTTTALTILANPDGHMVGPVGNVRNSDGRAVNGDRDYSSQRQLSTSYPRSHDPGMISQV
jgi:hypothetical protein